MENEELINKRIGKNIAAYRRSANLTQAELAQHINYSDKSVSKWESGNGVPDVYVMMQLADLFGVTVDDLVGEVSKKRASYATTRLIVMLLSSMLIWFIATAVFLAFQLLTHATGEWWLVFVYAVPVNAVLVIVLSATFRMRLTNFMAINVFIWGVIACTYLTSFVVSRANGTPTGNLWLIFLIGIPLQAANILWLCLRKVRSRQARAKHFAKMKEKESEEKRLAEVKSAGERSEEKAENGGD